VGLLTGTSPAWRLVTGQTAQTTKTLISNRKPNTASDQLGRTNFVCDDSVDHASDDNAIGASRIMAITRSPNSPI
jgi:hypothetical protein